LALDGLAGQGALTWLVAEEAGSGDIWAIQCKFYAPHHRVQKADLDSFFTESGKHPFRKRMVIATAPFSKHAEDACRDQQIPVSILDLSALEQSPIDWEQFSWSQPERLVSRAKKQLRRYQQDAILDVLAGFQAYDRGKLIMACGTGKTFGRSFYVEQIVEGTLCTEGYAQTRIPAGMVKWPLPQLIPKITLSLCLLVDVVLLSVFFLTVSFCSVYNAYRSQR
jgi:predicted helicase